MRPHNECDLTVIDFSVARYRQLFDALRASINARTQAEAGLATFDSATKEDSSGWDLKTTLESLETDYQRQQAELDDRHSRERNEHQERFHAETASAESEYSRTAAAIKQRFNDEAAVVEQRHEENRWMLSSLMDDDSENSPKRRYEAAKQQLEDARDRLAARWEELKAIYTQATELLEQRRQSIPAGHEVAIAPRTRKEALEGFETADQTVRSQFEALKRQKIPRLFAGWLIVLLTLVAWGGLFAAGYLLIEPSMMGVRDVTPRAHVMVQRGGRHRNRAGDSGRSVGNRVAPNVERVHSAARKPARRSITSSELAQVRERGTPAAREGVPRPLRCGRRTSRRLGAALR